MKVPIMQQNDSIFAAQGHFRIIIFVSIKTIIVTTVIFTIITIVIINIQFYRFCVLDTVLCYIIFHYILILYHFRLD